MTYDPISRATIAVVGVVAVLALVTFSHPPQRVPLDTPDLRATDAVSVMLPKLETTHIELGHPIEQGTMPRPERDILMPSALAAAAPSPKPALRASGGRHDENTWLR